jgi:hypothetical protein
VKNEQCYTIANWWKYVQFVVIFHLLTHKCLMSNYENLKE